MGNFFCFESKRNMKTFFLIVACIGLLIDGGFTRSTDCNWAGMGPKCWTGGVGPIRSCDNGLICYNGNSPAQDGYCLYQDGHCIIEPFLNCFSVGTKCWTANVGPIGTKACCDGLTCYNGNSPAQDGFCLAL